MINRKQVEDFFYREIKFTGIPRELKVESVLNKVLTIIGPRRAGKTWFFFSLYEKLENPMYVDLEDIAFRQMTKEEFFEIMKIFSEIKYEPQTIMIDEVQSLKGWETLVRSLQNRRFKVFITGSSSKLLSKEIATQLRGRSLTYLLLPFSFREFLKAKNFTPTNLTFEKKGTLLKLLREYMEYGGFPEVVLSDKKERILKEYFDEIFYKDFVERHNIKSLEFGRFLFEFIVQNFSKEISMRKIKTLFQKNVSYSTLYSYVEKLEDTLSVFFLKRFSSSVYTRTAWPRKVYVCDVGIPSILKFSEKIGDKMENLVFLDLMRWLNRNPLTKVYYLRTNDKEVDFVIKEGLRVKQLIQVTYASAVDEIEKRETKNLIKTAELFKKDKPELLVITWDYEDSIQFKGKTIKFIPLWKWLLKVNP